jgi:hypothetical protein
MYKSWFNINKNLYNNNTFAYRWFNLAGTGFTTIQVSVPDGYYDVTTLQLFFESEMFKNGHYLQNIDTGLNEYFISFRPNEIQYKIQLYCYPVPTTLTDGSNNIYIKPGDTWGLPVGQSVTPKFVFLQTSNFGKLMGFSPREYPTGWLQNSIGSFIGDLVPQINPISGILVTCSLINNDILIPSNIMYQFADSGISFGGLISVQPSQMLYVNTIAGYHSSIVLEFKDQKMNNMEIIDPSMVILLSVLTQV